MPSNQTKVEGKTLNLSSNIPERIVYKFGGWATTSSGTKAYDKGGSYTLNSGTTLYAIWNIEKYTLTLNANGGSVSPTSISQNYGAAITLPTPERTGYTFNGWYTAASGGSIVSYTTMPAINQTLFAQWTVQQYTLTFNANGGSVSPTSISQNYGTAITLPTPTKDGYRFNGWYTAASGGSRVSYTTMPATNQTLFAQWGDLLTGTMYYSFSGTTTDITRGVPSITKVGSSNEQIRITTGYLYNSTRNIVECELTLYNVSSGTKILLSNNGTGGGSSGQTSWSPIFDIYVNSTNIGQISSSSSQLIINQFGTVKIKGKFVNEGTAEQLVALLTLGKIYDSNYNYTLVEKVEEVKTSGGTISTDKKSLQYKNSSSSSPINEQIVLSNLPGDATIEYTYNKTATYGGITCTFLDASGNTIATLTDSGNSTVKLNSLDKTSVTIKYTGAISSMSGASVSGNLNLKVLSHGSYLDFTK